MTQDPMYPDGADDMRPQAGARRVSTSRAERGRRGAAPAAAGGGGRGGRGGRRKAPQPGKVVFRVITASLLTLGLFTGVGVSLVYNNLDGNITRVSAGKQVKNRPPKEVVEGPKEPLNILVMGTDTRSGKGNGIDGEAGGGLSDTTILFHVSADRKFAYGISIPRDTAVMRPTCYRKDGSAIAGSGGFVKWNDAFAVGGPFCTIQQFEQLSKIRVDKYLVVDFNQFKDMVNALDGVEVCIPEDINDTKRNIFLKAGTREIKGNEALTYVRLRYRVGSGTDTDRTRRQQAFIGSMINKALTAGMISRPDRMVRFLSAATSSLQTDFGGLSSMADVAFTARGIGADNIKFVTTPWVYSDKVSGGIEWTPEVNKLWRLVRKDRPLTPEFLSQAISAGDAPDGSSSASASPSPTPSQSPSNSPSPSGSPSPGTSPTPTPAPGGLDAKGREDVGLCA